MHQQLHLGMLRPQALALEQPFRLHLLKLHPQLGQHRIGTEGRRHIGIVHRQAQPLFQGAHLGGHAFQLQLQLALLIPDRGDRLNQGPILGRQNRRPFHPIVSFQIALRRPQFSNHLRQPGPNRVNNSLHPRSIQLTAFLHHQLHEGVCNLFAPLPFLIREAHFQGWRAAFFFLFFFVTSVGIAHPQAFEQQLRIHPKFLGHGRDDVRRGQNVWR